MFYHITVRLQIFCTLLISSSYRTVSSAILGNIFRVSHILQLISRAFRRVKYRSSTPEVFCKEGALRNFAKFTIKHLCHSLFFNKVAGVRPATLLKKRPWHRYFPVNFAKFLRTPFPTEHLRSLLLDIITKYEKRQKYLPIMHEATCENYFDFKHFVFCSFVWYSMTCCNQFVLECFVLNIRYLPT